MGVKRLLPAAVAQAEVVAVGRAPPGSSDDAIHRGQHQRAFRTCEVCAAMERLFAGDGVGAPAVGVRDPPCRRTQREAGRLRGPYPFQRTTLGRGFCSTGPQSGHAEQDSAEHRKNHPSFCFMLSCPHRRPSCFLLLYAAGQYKMPPALRASGIGDYFRKCSSRRLSRPVRRGRLSVTTMGIGAGAAFSGCAGCFSSSTG